MASDQGYNPLRWNCEKQGCFNLLRRPKIEVFAGCFPRKINFGDVDGMVELNGFVLMLEWKTSVKSDIPTGQRIAYERITKSGLITVIVVVGNAETMACERYCLFFMGKKTGWVAADLDAVKARMKNWAGKYASRQKPNN